jgi:excisionase family DNA binding protein
MEKKFITIPELAKVLGLSRIAIFKKVKNGEIKATKIGRNYAIPIETLNLLLGKSLSRSEKKEIDFAVKRTVSEYGQALRLLGKD